MHQANNTYPDICKQELRQSWRGARLEVTNAAEEGGDTGGGLGHLPSRKIGSSWRPWGEEQHNAGGGRGTGKRKRVGAEDSKRYGWTLGLRHMWEERTSSPTSWPQPLNSMAHFFPMSPLMHPCLLHISQWLDERLHMGWET